MLHGICARPHRSQPVDRSIGKILAFSHRKYFGTIRPADEFAPGIQQFQRVPLSGIVTGGEDDAPGRSFRHDGHLDRRGGAQAKVHHFDTQ